MNELRFSKAKLATGFQRENGAVGLLMRPKGKSKEAVIIYVFLKRVIHCFVKRYFVTCHVDISVLSSESK